MNERLAVGTLSEADILADDNYLIRNFPRYNAKNKTGWVMGYDLIATPYTRSTMTLSGDVKKSGKIGFEFTLGILDTAQLRYLYVTLFAYRLSQDCTLYIRDRLSDNDDDTYITLNGMVRLPELTSEGLLPHLNRFYDKPTFTFYNGVFAALS